MSKCIGGLWRRARCVLCIPGLLGPLDAAHAGVEWNGSFALTSDYVQQGVSQSHGEATLQGGLRAQLDEHWTVGTWASGIDPSAGAGGGIEIDLYAARAWQITPEWIAAVTATHYFYAHDARVARYDYDEVSASMSYRSALFATVAWSPNYVEKGYWGVAADRSALSYELSANQPITSGWSGNAGVGYRDLSELFDERYWYGHAGLMHSFGRLTAHVTYTYVDRTARRLFGYERAASGWSGTLIWRFGDID